MNSRDARKRSTIKVLVITPIIVAAMVLGGTFVGLSIGSVLGLPKAIIAATLGTLCLFAALPIVVKITDRIVKQEYATVDTRNDTGSKEKKDGTTSTT